MNFPHCWEFQTVSHWSDDFCDREQSFLFGRHLFMVNFLNLTKPDPPFWMEWRLFFDALSSLCKPIRGWPMLLLNFLSTSSFYPRSSETSCSWRSEELLSVNRQTSIWMVSFAFLCVFYCCGWIWGWRVQLSTLLGARHSRFLGRLQFPDSSVQLCHLSEYFTLPHTFRADSEWNPSRMVGMVGIW